MEEYGVDMKTHRATNIKNSKIKEMDLILCATISHKSTLKMMYPELANKIYTMKEYCLGDLQDIDIKDPWGYDIETYRKCASEIDMCLEKLIKELI